MAKSAEQIKQSAANKAQKYVSWNNTDYTTTPNTSASELAAEKASLEGKHNDLNETHINLEKAHNTLANEKASLEGKHEDLKKTHENLQKAHNTLANEKASLEGKYEDLKIKFSNDNKFKSSLVLSGITKLEDLNKENTEKIDYIIPDISYLCF